MMQTRIDQFYKIASSGRKSVTVEDKVRNVAYYEGQASYKELQKKASPKKLKIGSVYKNSKSKYKEKMSHSTSMTDIKHSPAKSVEIKTIMSPTTKHGSPTKNQQDNATLHSGSKYSPKTYSSVRNTSESSRRRLFKDEIDELLCQTVDNLNLIKEGCITNNNIDLEKVYSSRVFTYKYNPIIDTTTSTRYEINDVIVPTDTYSLHLFSVIVTVLSNPINCGYFDKDEADLIFSLLTLSNNAQALLIRMLKRKQLWHRIDSIKYNEVSDDLKPIFEELVSRSLFTNSIEKEDISVILNLLQLDEIRKLCQELKVGNTGRKANYIQSLLKFCNKTKSLFPGMQSPANKLHISVNRILGYCVLLNTKVKQIIDRIITLLMPNRDPTETLANTFLMLLRVQTKQIMFPEIPISNFPIFASKISLLSYIEAKNTLTYLLDAIEKKKWHIVRDLGLLASQHLSDLLEAETQSFEDSMLPRHIRHLTSCYIWLKVLSKSIDAFKKTKETMPQAIEFLRTLINQNCHMQSKKGQWYNELIKIEMYHRKNFDDSAELISKAIQSENLTEVDKLDLLDRAKMLVKRKSGISKYIKENVKIILDNTLSNAQLISATNSITIEGTLCRNFSSQKSTWRISSNMDEQVYGSVESLALHYYKCEGYPKGVHCEGILPITLFCTLFWGEIYGINIPGACVSLYQDAPMDLYSSQFYENRKEQIDKKLQIIRKFDSQTLSRHLGREFSLYCEYKSISQNNIFDDSSFQEIVHCLGVVGVIGICERLIHNFVLWKAGFPDLIVWNACTKQHKIVEVKGPGDSLSTKQKLWLDYLNQLGLNTEICYCKSNTDNKGGHKRKCEAMT